jgi:hypothetical protein
MRQKFFIFLGLILLIGLLIGINAVSYVQKDKIPDTELTPNRSTYNSGSTGTRAFYDLLAETGRKVTRWQEKPFALLNNAANSPKTFVIIGQTRLKIEKPDAEQILKWVANGGKLVIIDREPTANLLKTDARRLISSIPSKDFAYNTDPSNPAGMIGKELAGKPTQPTIFTRNINAVQPSRFTSSVSIQPIDEKTQNNSETNSTDDYDEDEPPPPVKTPIKNGSGNGATLYPKPTPPLPKLESETSVEAVPFVHIATPAKNILVDFPYGAGQIVYLTDPYIVSNAGISLVDNAQLGLNIISSRDGLIAFDEYHQGYGLTNPLLDYFEGTPLIPVFLQLMLLLGVIFYTISRRFARPLPADEPNRLSKLEYISAMAELQQSTRAYDLAVENIYTEFRRSVTRHFGVDNYTTSRRDLAGLIAERTKFNASELENLMSHCENIMHGEPTNKREVLELTSRLREIEDKLNLKRKRKEAFRK